MHSYSFSSVYIISLSSCALLKFYILFLQRPLPLSQVKAPTPKFDLAASNFPPLPGCSASPQGEPVLENRLSDVVRGLNRDKVSLELMINVESFLHWISISSLLFSFSNRIQTKSPL